MSSRLVERIQARETLRDATPLPRESTSPRVEPWMGPVAHLVAYPISAARQINVVAIVIVGGMIDLSVGPEKMAAFRANGELEINGGKQYFPNEYCTLIDEPNPKRAALTKVDATGTKLIPISDCREGVWGIKPRNREQH